MMTNTYIKSKLAEVLKSAVFAVFGEEIKQKLGIEALFHSHIIDRPTDITKGEYTTSLALMGAKLFDLSAVESAIAITNILSNYLDNTNQNFNSEFAELISKVEVAGPGFINFYIQDSVVSDMINFAKKEQSNYGKINLNTGKKIAYEYTDPNPFKIFHVGHLMSNVIGESLSRLGEYSGAEIKRFCYQGDIGRHVALFVFGLRFMDSPFPTQEEGEAISLLDRIYFMGTSYAKGATFFKEHPEFEPEIQLINKKLYDKSDDEINDIYNLGLEWSLQYFETLYKKLGTKFDRYFFESECVATAQALIEYGLSKNIFTESEGAIIFEGEKFQNDKKGEKLHTRVFVTKIGLPTYDAKELGFAKLKYNVFDYDKSIVVTANEQDQYFKVNLKVQSLILPELEGKNIHISHGMMILPTGKMSSRTGDVVSAEEMIDLAKQYVIEVMKDRQMDEVLKDTIVLQIAIAGIKYIILRQSSNKNVVFDVKKALSFEGDSGPYLQYSVVRGRSVIERAHETGIQIVDFDLSVFDESKSDIVRLAKKVFVFSEILERAYIENSSHILTTYLTELSAIFNAVYANNKIIDVKDEASRIQSEMLVSLIESVVVVLTNGLYVLGIEVPEKM